MTKVYKKIAKGASLLTFGEIASYTLSFVRNLILARILTKADFGLAAALSMGISLLELVNRMGIGRQIIQASAGDDPEFQASAHTFQLTVGVISALLVLIAAYPMALAFKVPGKTWAFMMLAFVPLTRGAVHLDIMRVQRRFNYGPGVWCEVIPQILSALAAWPLAVWLADFRAVLFIMLGRELFVVALSHFFAERRFRLGKMKKYGKEMLSFGWPLLINGFVMFAAQQGDQILIGSTFSLADLATYSIAFTIASIPFMIFAQVNRSLMLPYLAQLQDNHYKFQMLYKRCLEFSVFIPLLLVGPLLIAGDQLVEMLYGSKYADTGTLIVVFGSVVAVRFFRLVPTVASMAKGNTTNLLLGNIVRTLSFFVALILVWLGVRDMVIIAGCGFLGEALAILVVAQRLQKQHGITMSLYIRPFLFLVAWIFAGSVVYQLLLENANLYTALPSAFAFLVGGVLSFLAFFSDARVFLRTKCL